MEDRLVKINRKNRIERVNIATSFLSEQNAENLQERVITEVDKCILCESFQPNKIIPVHVLQELR